MRDERCLFFLLTGNSRVARITKNMARPGRVGLSIQPLVISCLGCSSMLAGSSVGLFSEFFWVAKIREGDWKEERK